MKKVIVIGGGLAGLTAASYLAKNNYDVTIYEKNNNLGGFVTYWTRKNQLIDGCIHWLLGTSPKGDVNKIYQEMHAFDNDEVIQLESFYKVFYEGETLTFYNDIDKLEKELYRVSVNDDKEIEKLIDAIKCVGIFELDTSCPKELKEEGAQGMTFSKDFFRKTIYYMANTIEQVAEKFNSPIIKYALLNSLIDKKFVGLYLVETLANLVNGNAGVPKGGSKSFIENIKKNYESLGGKYVLNKEVEKVIIEDDKAIGILLKDGTVVESDYVISSTGVHHTFSKLLKNKYNPSIYDLLDSQKDKFLTYSFYIVSFKTKADLSKKQNSEIYKVKPYTIGTRTYDSFLIRHYAYDDLLKTDGYSTIEILVPTYEDDFDYLKTLDRNEYNQLKKKLGEICLEKFEEVNYLKKDELELIDIATPLTMARYMNAYKGSYMPYMFIPRVNVELHSNRVEGLSNFYIANQWQMLPGGTPVATVSGKFAAQIVMHDDKNRDQ